jgi:hypothetical protein
MCFTRLLIEVHVGAHLITSSFNALHEVLLTSAVHENSGARHTTHDAIEQAERLDGEAAGVGLEILDLT